MLTIRLEPSGQVISVVQGARLREALQEAGVLLDYPCGGKGSCRQCRLIVEPAPDSGKGRLTDAEVSTGVRLACQLIVEADCTVTIPEERLSRRLWTHGLRDEDIRVEGLAPSIARQAVSLAPPSLEDQRPDWERLGSSLDSLGISAGAPDAGRLQEISGVLREGQWSAEVLSEDGGFLWFSAGQGKRVCGLAVDLGTTTVDIALLDLQTGERLARRAALNRQVSFGADVISRAQSYHSDAGPVRKAALETIQENARSLLEDTGTAPRQVVKTVVVGNPIMIHILNGIDPYNLTLVPYVPAAACAIRSDPRDLGWDFQRHGYVETLPLISAYVGADTVAMILSLDLDGARDTTLAIDIGTNGEMVLARHGELVATSTAAGPAFEGAQISCGMRALEGAVYGAAIDDDGELSLLVVGGSKPKGICGTGLVAAVAQMLDAGIIDATGRLADPSEVRQGSLRARLGMRGSETVFRLSENDEVFISQGDIRKLQLAKAAVRTGAETLLAATGVPLDGLDALRLAGNFGAGLDAAAAMRVGLIPPVDMGKIEVVGNAALRGAALALLSRDQFRKAERAAREARFVELGGRPDFQARFIESMMF